MRKYLTKIDGAAPAPEGVLGAPEDNWRFAEMVGAVVSAGITPDAYNAPSDSDTRMLAQAMAKYASAAIFCQDTGNANVYLLKLTGSYQPPKELKTGLRVAFYPANASTAASVVNAFSLGPKKLFRADGTPTGAGDLAANRLTYALYDESLDAGNGGFRLAPWSVPSTVQAPSAVPQDGEGVDVDTVYRSNLAFNPLTAASPVDADVWAYFSQALNGHRKVTTANLLALIRSALSIGNLSLPKVGPAFRVEERRPNLQMRLATTNAWSTRPLSDVVVNQIPGLTFSPSQISLGPGTYRADFLGVVESAPHSRCRLFNLTSGAVLGQGTAVYDLAEDPASPPSMGTAWFSISQTSRIELQYYCIAGLDPGPGSGIVHAPTLGDSRLNDIGSGNYYVDGWVSIVKEG